MSNTQEHSFTLHDDGTMDTVVSCDTCGYEMRYSPEFAALYRNKDTGAIDFYTFVVETVIPDHITSGECEEE